jgi:NAD(P)-dependent dehydrogenase (short-subunit alcohol dehydrogenase family)
MRCVMDTASRHRTALVTGANRGLGLETVRQLARRGFHVVLTSRSQRDGRPKAESLTGPGRSVEYRPLDVTDAKSVDALAAHLRGESVHLDVLVNNAGIAPKGFTAQSVQATLDVNFFGVERVTDALLPVIRDGGSIVMVSSGLGELSTYYGEAIRRRLLDPHLTRHGLDQLMHEFVGAVTDGRHAEAGWPASAYRVSKAALNALTRVLARELSPRRIRVNAVCPGWVRTDMGGRSADRGVEAGAASIVWAALASEGPTGGFFRDGEPIPW